VGGDVLAECLSSSSVFVQSGERNHHNGYSLNHVIEVSPGQSMHIFNGQKFDDLLNESMQGGIDALYDIIDACKIKIGFIEDWRGKL
jgi:hypothetical protein